MSSSIKMEPVLEIPPDKIPRHVAIIMDGNGRWAQRRDQPRNHGHQNGAESARKITEECARLGIDQLTLFCLSSENWKRPQEELDFLMFLLATYLVQERDTMMKNNIRLKIIGRRDRLPQKVISVMDQSIAMTSGNTGTCLCLAINYGGRAEIVDAMRQIAKKIESRELDVESIDESTVSQHLYTSGMSDPDLLIRTAGEMRISNYLLWQISYAELWVTHRMWPEFQVEDFHDAIRDYANRSRRFGGLTSKVSECSKED
ncbi:MAG: isoprenyl transferase [Planctomycetota bacterium]